MIGLIVLLLVVAVALLAPVLYEESPWLMVGDPLVRPFAEAMFGAAHINTNGFGSDTSFATAIGGGLDYKIFHLLAWRFEGDFIRTSLFNTTQHNARFTTGVVLRF